MCYSLFGYLAQYLVNCVKRQVTPASCTKNILSPVQKCCWAVECVLMIMHHCFAPRPCNLEVPQRVALELTCKNGKPYLADQPYFCLCLFGSLLKVLSELCYVLHIMACQLVRCTDWGYIKDLIVPTFFFLLQNPVLFHLFL